MPKSSGTLAATQGALNQAQVETGVTEEGLPIAARIRQGKWTITLEGPRRAQVSIEHQQGHTLIHLDLPAGELGEYHISVDQPFMDIHRSWIGQVDCWRGRELTSIALNITFETAVNCNIPAVCNYDRHGENRGVVGLMDHQPLTTVNQRTVIDRPPMQWLRTRFTRSRVQGGFRETVVLTDEAVPFAVAIQSHLHFCRDGQNITPLAAPDWARQPVWCSWYSHLYGLTQADVEAQIETCKQLGVRTLLLDASWFKAPGVAYSHVWGDYHLEKSLIPDMLGLSRKIHAAGLKLMLWCSPVYVGKKATIRPAMERYCALVDGVRQDRLCPQCPEAIVHARQLVERLMREYELDGLKLDFMDCIDDPPCTDPAHHHGSADHHQDQQQHFGSAMAHMLSEIRAGIVSVNPQAAIEYRIRYSNVATLGMANCHRGNDAPYDGDYIRRENLYLRLFCDERSAVWSDYAYWHQEETPANVGLLLGQQIFSGGVPTLSIDLPNLSSAQQPVVQEWLAFYHQHTQPLSRAKLRIHTADSCMSVSSLCDETTRQAYVLLSGQHIPPQIELPASIRKVWLLNASAQLDGQMALLKHKTTLTLSGDGLQSFDL